MASQEGIIKFNLAFTPGDSLSAAEIAGINRWRGVMLARGLIGQDPNRYGGYGFGNISRRLPPYDAPAGHRRFVISGTQTGHIAVLGPEHYALVTEYDPDHNRVVATGPAKPSSESLTHSGVYDMDEDVHYVIHVHSPEIWHAAAQLGLPITDAAAVCGTPEMAVEVARLFAETDVRARRIFSMGGHEDGIVAFGRTADEAGDTLLACLEQIRAGGRA